MKKLYLLILSFIWLSALPAQQVWYVTVSGSGAQDGSSWGNAFSFIQDALDQAQAGDSVWVAAGTYKPTTGTDREVYLELPSGVVFMGGFAGWESSSEQRDLTVNTTIISGQLSSGQKSHMLMRVLNPAPGTRVDGVVFENSLRGETISEPVGPDYCTQAVFGDWTCYGGGLWVEVLDSVSAVRIDVSNCTFRNHFQLRGGGMVVNSYGFPEIFVENCHFANNGGYDFQQICPGLLSIGRIAKLDVSGSVFQLNMSGLGGAISVTPQSSMAFPVSMFPNGSLIISNSEFENNTGTSAGGAMYVQTLDSVILEGNKFINNKTYPFYVDHPPGGAVFIFCTLSYYRINQCLFDGNTCNGSGGGLAIVTYAGETPGHITNSVFNKNKSLESLGGAIFLLNHFFHDPILMNLTLYNNLSSLHGGAIYEAGSPSGNHATVANSIFYNNVSTTTVFDDFYFDNGIVKNTLFSKDFESQTSVLSSDVLWMDNLYESDPLFLDAANDDFRLSCLSPAIDAGDLSVVMDLGLMQDMDGLPRIHNGLPDIGAHEWQGLAADISQENATCYDYSDGFVQVQVNDGTPPYEYAWNAGGTAPTLGDLPAGEYTLTVTDSEGCESIYQLEITEPDPLWMQVQVGADTAGANSGWLWVDSISGGTAPYALQWSTGSTALYLEGLPGGTYGLSLVDAQGCTLDTVLQVDVILSTSFQRVTHPLNIFPNPTTGAFTLTLPAAAPEGMQVRIADMYGRELSLPNQPQIRTGTRQHTLDISHLPAGVYWVSVHRDEGEVYGGKLVVR